jgi:hypothetical protein
MLIKVTEVGDVETQKEGKRRWKQIRIDYETADKSDNYKILLDWANPDAYADAIDCKEDGFYEVKVVKNGKYWNWESISESDVTEFDDKPSSKSYEKATTSKGTDWAAKNLLDKERFEFEKEKQGLIIRQSCIGYAIQALGSGKMDISEYLALASKFEDQVIDGFLFDSTKPVTTAKVKALKTVNKEEADDMPD